MTAIYGLISDIHEDSKIIEPALHVLKRLGAEKLIVNGDIGGRMQGNTLEEAIQNSQNYTTFILEQIARSGLEAYVQPGSHETLLGYEPVIEYFSAQYSNIINTLTHRKVERNNHDLVFLPGSDFLCGGEYPIGNSDKIPSGKFILTSHGLIRFNILDQYINALNRGIAKGVMHYFNMRDLRTLVSNPEKTVTICHVPRKFDNLNCVDVAHFFESREYILGKKEYDIIGIYPKTAFNPEIAYRGNTLIYFLGTLNDDIESQVKIDMWIKGTDKLRVLVEQKSNRGNSDLKELYSQLGIRKAISGHFHESSHKAHDSEGNEVNQGELVNELFWNSGHLDNGLCGLLYVDGVRVSYQNIDLKDYIK